MRVCVFICVYVYVYNSIVERTSEKKIGGERNQKYRHEPCSGGEREIIYDLLCILCY